MPSMKDIQVDILKKIPLFGSLGKRELRHIAETGREIEFLAGATIVEQGEKGSDFYLIQSGQARIVQNGKPVGELGPGDYFGELAILYDSTRTASVHANTRVWVFRLDRQAFFDLLDRQGVIARKLLMGLAKRTRPVEASDLG